MSWQENANTFYVFLCFFFLQCISCYGLLLWLFLLSFFGAWLSVSSFILITWKKSFLQTENQMCLEWHEGEQKKKKIGEFFLWSGLWLKHITCYSTQTHKNVLKKSYPLQLRQLCLYLVDFKKTSHDAYIYLIISWSVFNKLSIGINRPCITIHSSPAFSYICQFITFRGVWL